MADDDTEIWVAHRLPFPDGSGTALVLGAHPTEEGAQAACWRDRHSEQPTEVVLCYLGDPENQEET